MEKFRLERETLFCGRFNHECFATFVLRSGIHVNVSCAYGIKAILNGSAGEFRAIAIPAEVPQENVVQVGGNQVRKNVGCGVVAEMTMPTHDALLHAPWALQIVLQQLHVMIRFQNKDVGCTDSFHDQFRGVAEIGQETDLATVRPQHEADRIVGIVRH